MTVEGFVRAAGGVMGGVRDGFGTTGFSVLPIPAAPPLSPPPPQTPGTGQAAQGQEDAAWEVNNKTAALDSHDATGDTELQAAMDAAQGGREDMDSIIGKAVADVEALGFSTNTPEGKRALITAIMHRLEETRGTADRGTADAGTHAANTAANVAGYNDILGPGRSGTPVMNPAAGMPGMGGGIPSMGGSPGGGFPSFGQPLNALSGLVTPLTQKASRFSDLPTEKTRGKARDLDTGKPGKADERGLQKYTKLMNRAVSAAFPEIKEVGGVRKDSLHWHPSGLALDFMIPNWDTAQGRQLGNEVVNFLIRNKAELGLDHIIWRQQMIQSDGSASMMQDRGDPTQNHFDHVHAVSIGGGR